MPTILQVAEGSSVCRGYFKKTMVNVDMKCRKNMAGNSGIGNRFGLEAHSEYIVIQCETFNISRYHLLRDSTSLIGIRNRILILKHCLIYWLKIIKLVSLLTDHCTLN